MNRKEIEDKFGFSRKEIRYLEDIGIINNVDKVKGKEYEYSDEDTKRFYLVRFFKDCGYKVNDIKAVFSKYDDEKQLVEESISKMKEQIKKLKDNLKLAQTMKKNNFMSFSEYSLMANRMSKNYNEISLGYILMTEIYNLSNQNMKDIYSFNIDDLIERIIDAALEDVSELDDMIIEHDYTEKELYTKAALIIEKIADVSGFYSDPIITEGIKALSLIDGLSEETIPFITNYYSKNYSQYKEKSIEYVLDRIGTDLMLSLKDNSYTDEVVQGKLIEYLNLSKKMMKEDQIIKIFKQLNNKPENIISTMNALHINENEAKRICNEFLKAIEYYEKQNIH